MRKLKPNDIGACCKCLKTIGVKEKMREIAKAGSADAWTNGFEQVWSVFDAATEDGGLRPFYAFLSGPFEMTPEAVEDLDLDIFIRMVKQLTEENNIPGFFKFVENAMKQS